MRSFTPARLLAALLVGSASLTLYLITLAPTLTWANAGTDGGDLVTAAATLGIPHPPGYPLYTTLGYLIAQLPIGTVAFRLNLVSAVCMALAAAVIAWSVTPTPALRRPRKNADREGSLRPYSIDRFSSTGAPAGLGMGILAGLAFAAAPMVWGQATIAEVHALNALLVAAILALLAPSVFRGAPISSRRLSFALFVWGLSLTHQLAALALTPLFFVAVRRSLITRHSALVTRYAVRLTQYVFPFFLPLTLYLLLLPRAAAQPPINWLGTPTLENFWSFITAELYRGYAFTLPLTDYLARLIAFAQMLVSQFGWIGLGLIGLGIYRVRRRAIAPLIAVALYAIFAFGYNTADSYLYLIPVWLFGAYALVAGTRALAQYAPRITYYAGLVTRHSSLRSIPVGLVTLLLIALIPGLSIINNFAALDLRSDHIAEDFAQGVLAAAPANAIIITHRDAHTFTLWYYRHVETQRPDVAIIDARLAAYPWYDSMLRAQNARRAHDQSLHKVEFDPEDTWPTRLRAANSTRPVCDVDVTTAQLHCGLAGD